MTATIFVREKRWLEEDESGVLDVRFGTQTLPAGCWVACFIVPTLSGVKVLEDVPYLPGPWDQRYKELRRYAIEVLETGQGKEPEWL